VAGYARWRAGGCAELADEVIQETWLTAARRLKAFDPEKGSFAAWVTGIAANESRNQFRTRRRRRTEPLPRDGLAAESTISPEGSADRVAAALAGLPDRYEQVLRAKYLDGSSVEQIAAARRETPKAIESLLSRARQAFRENYDRETE
jgi:RNA polymerase sigma-70 factor (ECF subfamily)